jgi:general secretion pathway protein A
MDYLDFYGLGQEPFSSAPVSRFYYNSAQHQRALIRLQYAVDTMKGLAVLIGDLGTGKTTLARRMLDELPEEEYESALLVIIHSGITADWLLARIARQLGVEDPPGEKLKLLNQLYNRLIELHESKRKPVVLIDEAQMLHTREIMEEFRGLLNLEFGESKLITFVLFGLPELEDHLHLDEPLAQRVALKCNLECFNEESTQGYVNHRLRLAGAKSGLFTPEALKLIHHYSRGIPRLINTICDNALFEGYLLKKRLVEPELVQSVVTDLGLVAIPKAAPRRAQGRSADVIPVSAAGIQSGELAPAPTPIRRGPANPPPVIDSELPEGVAIEPLESESGAGAAAANAEQDEINSMLDDLEEK